VLRLVTNHPNDITVCIGGTVNISCGFTGALPEFVIPDWRIVKKNSDSSVISDEVVTGSSIVNSNVDGLRWVPDLTSGPYNARNSVLMVGPVDETYSQSSYQCIFASSNGRVESRIGTVTVAGM